MDATGVTGVASVLRRELQAATASGDDVTAALQAAAERTRERFAEASEGEVRALCSASPLA